MADEDLATRVREAVLALEGTVIEDLILPLPGDLKDLSKAAAMVSGIVEDRIPALLNSVRDRTWDEDGELHAYEFRRFTIGFPDILLVERADHTNVLFQMEAKSWYALASDPITARFQTSSQVMEDGTIIAIVAWVLDGVVAGSPKFARVHTCDAKALADLRDQKWEATAPEGSHRVIQPDNLPDTTPNLLKSLTRAEMKNQDGEWRAESENFGKIHRIYDPGVQQFEAAVKAILAAGKPLKDWHTFIKSNPSA